MKSVCIVGAGPAGLVAAKTFLQTGQFDVTVYEKNDRLGGIWALDEETQDGFLHPSTPTNLSRFTVAFSDHDWNSVDLRSKHDIAAQNGDTGHRGRPPMFPRAWQVNRYLEEYRRKFVPDDCTHYGMEVVQASRASTLVPRSDPCWRITSKDKQRKEQVEEFDYLLVASGFFSKPRPLEQEVPQAANGITKATPVRKIHSSQFKSLRNLFPDERGAAGKTILLIGGGNSGGEAAAAVAAQLSDAQWSPERSCSSLYRDCKIVHVCPRQLYPLAPYHEYEQGSYIPIDFKLYDVSRRPPGPVVSYGGQQPKEVRTLVHGMMQGLVGGDQSDLGSEALLAPGDGEEKRSVYVALSESYPEYVRSGLIEAIKGRVTSINDSGSGTANAAVQKADQAITIDNVGAIIYCTGYTPSAALSFLADDVKEALHYDPDSMRLPLILEQWQTMNSAVPSLAFLGFYEGPYWPMEEMQARLTADRWLDDAEEQSAPKKPFEEREKLLQLRQAMKDKAVDVPQYWFGDYLGYMEDIAAHLKLEHNDSPFSGERQGVPSPARYLSPTSNKDMNSSIMSDIHSTWQGCIRDGRYVARAAFRALQGHWNISRGIESADPNFSGTLEGKASFHPRFPTQDMSGRVFDLEYLYIETGTFTSSANPHLKLTAKRRYAYRYSESRDELSIWFVRPDSDLEVDYLFHKLAFVPPAEARKEGACVARADHLCVEDMYYTEYRLPMKAIALPEWEIRHTVKGPKKDYVATTKYSRPAVRSLMR